MLKLFGAHLIDLIDASDYEQATIMADMNYPIPNDIHNSYDIVFDGGSLEHVFNVEQALRNVMSLPKIGGNVIIHTMANNCLGHGFYQFSPELFYRVFSPENGYRIERMVVHPNYAFAHWYDVPDPAEVRGRIELTNDFDVIMMFIHARRLEIVPIFEKPPQQSDYAAAWKAATPTQVRDKNLKRRIIEMVPWAARIKHQIDWTVPVLPRTINALKHRREGKRLSARAQPTRFRQTNR